MSGLKNRFVVRRTTLGQWVVMDKVAGKVMHADCGSELKAVALAQELQHQFEVN